MASFNMSAPTTSSLQSEGLRERNVAPISKDESYSSPSSSDDEVEAENGFNKQKKTFGRTPDGTG
jgi:hypothetical protein